MLILPGLSEGASGEALTRAKKRYVRSSRGTILHLGELFFLFWALVGMSEWDGRERSANDAKRMRVDANQIPRTGESRCSSRESVKINQGKRVRQGTQKERMTRDKRYLEIAVVGGLEIYSCTIQR